VADLATLAQLKDYIGEAGSGEDTTLQFVLSGVSEAIQREAGRALATHTVDLETHRVGTRSETLLLRDRPLIAATEPVVVFLDDRGFTFAAAAVDTTLDQVAFAEHDLATADGPMRIYALGSGSTVPAGLTARTVDYWVIRADADTVALASSEAGALAGTRINLTSQGAGTIAVVGPRLEDRLDVDLPIGVARRRTGAAFDPGLYLASYSAGYGTAGGLPDDLEMATIKQAAFEARNTKKRGVLGSRRTQVESATVQEYLIDDWAPGVLPIVRRYRGAGLG